MNYLFHRFAKRKNKFLKISIIILLLFTLFSKPAYAFEPIIEEFNSDFSDPNRWKITNVDGIISFTENPGFITLKGPGFSFPYIQTTELINLDQDFEIEIAFQYLPSTFDFGAGIALSNAALDKEGQIVAEKTVFGIWQDNGPDKLRVSTNVCPQSNPECTGPTSFFKTTTTDTNYHVVKYRYNNGIYEAFVNEKLELISTSTTFKPNSIWFGNPKTVSQSNKWSNFKIDYIYIKPLQAEEPGLPVPYFSQRDPAWGNHEYDFASQWSTDGVGIKNWGCALTSACMVMKYHGINKLPDGNELNPDTVNSWLISQPDGYVNGGLLNWIALTRLAELINQVHGSTKLELVRRAYAPSRIKQDLAANLPSILHIIGHFIVVRGEQENNFLIHDPYYENKKTYAFNEGTFTVNTFKPSNTNLSAILLTTDLGVDILVTSPEGSRTGTLAGQIFDEIPDALVAKEEPIINPEDQTSQSGSGNMLTYMQPENGEYKITISSPTTQIVTTQGFVYNQNGEPTSVTLNSLASPENPAEFILNFSQTELPEAKPQVDFDKLIADIKNLYELKEIKILWLKTILLNLTYRAKFFSQKYHHHGKRITKHFLEMELKLIDRFEEKYITSTGARILRQDIEALLESLN